MKRGRWVLKKGELIDDEDKVLVNFDGKVETFKNNMKTIVTDDEESGFSVTFERFQDVDDSAFLDLIVTADGTSTYTKSLGE